MDPARRSTGRAARSGSHPTSPSRRTRARAHHAAKPRSVHCASAFGPEGWCYVLERALRGAGGPPQRGRESPQLHTSTRASFNVGRPSDLRPCCSCLLRCGHPEFPGIAGCVRVSTILGTRQASTLRLMYRPPLRINTIGRRRS